MSGSDTIIGLDIGGTKTAIVLGDSQGRVSQREVFATNTAAGFAATFDTLCCHVTRMLDRAHAAGGEPVGLSVAIGGPLEIARGVIHGPPNLPGWDAIPLKELLEDRFRLPAHVQHDGNAGALAEWYFGAARGCRNVVFLTLGTGLGAGLILNGALYTGTCDLAGEVGHLRMAETGPVGYGKAGSWEGLCSGAGIVKLAALRSPARWNGPGIELSQLANAARARDPEALALFNEVGRYLGRGLALLVDTLNPKVIVLGALAIRLGELILSPAWAELRREALPRGVATCRVVPAALGERLGDVASLCAVINAQRARQRACDTHLGGKEELG